MKCVKFKVEHSQTEVVSQRLQLNKWIVDVSKVRRPHDGSILVATVRYKRTKAFNNWLNAIRRVEGVQAAESISETEYDFLIQGPPRREVTDRLPTMRINATVDLQSIERIATQLSSVVGVLSVFTTSGRYQLEVTIRASEPYQLSEIIIQKISKICPAANVETVMLLMQY